MIGIFSQAESKRASKVTVVRYDDARPFSPRLCVIACGAPHPHKTRANVTDIDEGTLPPVPVTTPIKGLVYEDKNGNGRRDDPTDEPGIPDVDVVITYSNNNVVTVSMMVDGTYQVEVPDKSNGNPDKATIDVIIERAIPPSQGTWVQTAGFDPSLDKASPTNIRHDGYCWLATSPTGCCYDYLKKVRIRQFLNRSGSPMSERVCYD